MWDDSPNGDKKDSAAPGSSAASIAFIIASIAGGPRLEPARSLAWGGSRMRGQLGRYRAALEDGAKAGMPFEVKVSVRRKCLSDEIRWGRAAKNGDDVVRFCSRAAATNLAWYCGGWGTGNGEARCWSLLESRPRVGA